MEQVTFGVLGPVVAWGSGGGALALKGPRHRAVLARLIVARRRVVPLPRLIEDLWDEPPRGATGAVRTFVADLRRALEPDRPPRAPARLLVTEGPGYALHASPDAVDAWRLEAAVGSAAALPPARALERLREALELWRGPAYADFADEDWARGERSRLAELRLQAVEQLAETRLALGAADAAVPDLDAHLAEHPWREDAWRLLALALYRTGRQQEALAVLRRARTMLADRLGLDPGPRLRRLEADILTHDPRLDPRSAPAATAARVWAEAAEAYDRTVAAGARARLESTVGLLRNLAVTGGGGLQAAREHRTAAITAAEEFGDPGLTARVIGAYDVPAIWTRCDDPRQAQRIVAAAERTLAVLPGAASYDAARCRLLATVALETRGTRSPRGPQAARHAEEIARRLDDPALLAFALNGTFMQSCTRAGLAARRDAIGEELVALAAGHGLVTFEVLGHLIRLQARCALGDFPAADEHAAAAECLAARHELPLVGVFTQWYGALRLAAAGRFARAEAAYRAAATGLEGSGMPGLRDGLLPLALLCLRLTEGGLTERGLTKGGPSATEHVDPGADWGPYRPWAEPFVLLRGGRRADAQEALRALPEPPADLLYEALCCLQAAAALALGDRPALRQAQARLRPAAGQLAGAGSGLVTLGPVDDWLEAADAMR
ncbi:BTAD domain-containing putative transcriptional regulator [Streptomyces sp. UNOC14_S4]|uniref:BTAD domain-containing putative transcriptional regulator n=1 Tax=Streptomyces sp. UNOC14_S4 TaxID=2872340 RepID=UPI001E4543DB|nr:BTAD domain-containing putative transcriptional regulator [Streptomyces sp. UNOC14_S4]MCC3766211.1 winged helix-turn-helix domain-containing protein [Streptomyces sp. UNOC14_S4]